MKEALRMALEAADGLKDIARQVNELIAENKALKAALAQPAPVQEPFCFVYVENGEEYFAPKGAYVPDNAQPLYTTPPAQPEPVQPEPVQPVAWLRDPKHYPAEDKIMPHVTWEKERLNTTPLYTTPPAQPAVPDAFGTREGEHPQYVQGWNDCRAETLKMRKP